MNVICRILSFLDEICVRQFQYIQILIDLFLQDDVGSVIDLVLIMLGDVGNLENFEGLLLVKLIGNDYEKKSQWNKFEIRIE